MHATPLALMSLSTSMSISTTKYMEHNHNVVPDGKYMAHRDVENSAKIVSGNFDAQSTSERDRNALLLPALAAKHAFSHSL